MTVDWRLLSAALEQESPVFVVGVPRSGTTALRATLDQHPSFRAREARSPETKVFAEPAAVLQVADAGAAERLRGYLLDDAAAIRALDAAARAAATALESDPTARERHLVRLFFHFAREARGVRRLLEKTPRHLDHLADIRAIFPRAQVLACVRHPVDAYSSYRKKLVNAAAKGGVQEKHAWLQLPPEKFARKYARWIEAATEAAAARAGEVRLVRYEELTAEPRAALRAICAFLGEPFAEREMFDALDVVRDAHGSPRPGHRIVENEKRWQDFLAPDEARTVERGAAEAMERLGYRPYVA